MPLSTFSLWVALPLLLALPTGVGFIIMAWRDIRTAAIKHHDYGIVILSGSVLCAALIGFLAVPPPSLLLWWIVFPFKLAAAAALTVFAWVVELVTVSWLVRCLKMRKNRNWEQVL